MLRHRHRPATAHASEAASLPPPRRRARGLPRARHRAAAGAVALRDALAHGVGAGVERLSERFRVVLPDLPLHGDSEDRPRHPYTIDWFAEVLCGFAADVLGPAAADRRTRHRRGDPAARGRKRGAAPRARGADAQPPAPLPQSTRGCAPPGGSPRAPALLPGVDRMLTHARAARAFSPRAGLRLSARGEPAARDLVRHAFADVPGNPSLARSWAKFARRWPRGAQTQLLELYPRLEMPVLLLWADSDRLHPLAGAEETLGCCPTRSCACCPAPAS